MNYIESEIDSTLKEHCIAHKKSDIKYTESLITALTTKFFIEISSTLDPTKLINAIKFYDTEYWKKISSIENCKKPILITLDSHYSSWQLNSTTDLQFLISESTGFPFWITDTERCTLIYLDDHDCVHIASQ